MSARLSQADRRLFSLVTEAAFANPFGQRRESLDAEIGGSAADDARWVERMLAKVESRLRDANGQPLDVRTLGEADRALAEYTVLFGVFHRFEQRLDALIAGQEQSERPLRVAFADELMGAVQNHGFTRERAVRVLELFYQMRRAFAFIRRGLVGRSSSMRRLREALWRAVFTHDIRRYERHLWNRMEDFSTILVGETGTGKGAAARAIGMSGFIPFDPSKSTFAHSFVEGFSPINLNELPETLFESEIFGHRKGAFTGAVDHHEGVLARCKDQGTVFFDEIGEATLPVQVKLLRVLQERVYSPVGSRETRRFSGRIVAATHRSLAELRASGALREDFYYRLSSNVIEIPSLRVRIAEDASELLELTQHLCARITGAADQALVAEVLRAIERDLGEAYAFAGNVRELEQCVRRVLLTGGCARDEQPALGSNTELASAIDRGTLTAEQMLDRYCGLLYARTRSYVEVAAVTGLDRRTVKKHVERAAASGERWQ